MARLPSSYKQAGASSFLNCFSISEKRFLNSSISRFISDLFASLAAVRIITPDFLGHNALPMASNLSRVFSSVILRDTPTNGIVGINTTYLPANETFEVSLTPFVPAGSFIACTIISSPAFKSVMDGISTCPSSSLLSISMSPAAR